MFMDVLLLKYFSVESSCALVNREIGHGGIDPRKIEVLNWIQRKFVGPKVKVSVLKYQIRIFNLLSLF
jgi:hypothetical protein